MRKILNFVGGVLASPSVLASKIRAKRSDRDFKILRYARNYDEAPNYDSRGRPTDAFKARSLADEVRTRLTRKAKKISRYE